MARKLCNVCGKRPAANFTNGQCDPCDQEGGWENTHNDGDHETVQESLEDVEYGKTNHKTEAEYLAWLKVQREEVAGCWICYPELNLAQKEPKAKKTGAAKTQGFRRTQLNHKEMCTHAQTSKARRTCKNAFWAGVQAMVITGGLTEDQAWEHCIKALVKPVAKDDTGTGSPTIAANAATQNAEAGTSFAEAAVSRKATTMTVVPRGPKGGVINKLKEGKPAKGKFLTKAEGKKLYGN
jgi:hypothetical protein